MDQHVGNNVHAWGVEVLEGIFENIQLQNIQLVWDLAKTSVA